MNYKPVLHKCFKTLPFRHLMPCVSRLTLVLTQKPNTNLP